MVEFVLGIQQVVGIGIFFFVEMMLNLFFRVLFIGEFVFMKLVGVFVELFFGIIQVVGISIFEEGVSEMVGDKGKIKW